MDRRRLLAGLTAGASLVALAACTASKSADATPGLEARGTVLTTVKALPRDVTNQVSVAGKVTIDPVFGIVAPVAGEVRYANRRPNTETSEYPIWVASIWAGGNPVRVEIPPGSVLAGRLMPDRSHVTAGMPVVSAAHSGYGIVADIDSAMAYRLTSATAGVTGQIKDGPGPFGCKQLGTIAALPAGTLPDPPVPSTPSSGASAPPAAGQGQGDQAATGSEPSGLRLVCVPSGRGVKLINGASVTLNVITARAAKVLTLPVEAVAGVQGKGKVDVVGADHQRRTVDVELGLTDGRYVQIRKGLTGDEDVAVPGPDLPAAAPAGDPTDVPR